MLDFASLSLDNSLLVSKVKYIVFVLHLFPSCSLSQTSAIEKHTKRGKMYIRVCVCMLIVGCVLL